MIVDRLASRLRGEPIQPGRKPELDGWRALAITSVLVGHFSDLPHFNAGRFGVELFLVLSGLLMANLLFVKQEPIGRFLWRRVTRVWPALFVFFGVICLVYAIPYAHILGTLLFVQNYVTIYTDHIPAIDHLWSISVEEWTYVLLAGVAVAARADEMLVRTIMMVLIVAMATSGLVQTLQGFDYYETYWRTDVRAASILMGGLAFLILRRRHTAPFVCVTLGLAGLMLHTQFFPDYVKYTLGTACLAATVATLKDAPRLVMALLSSRPLRWMATISFSLYLWQQPFFELLGKAPTAVLLLGALAAATASYLLVENPARNFLNKVRTPSSGRARKIEPAE